MSVVPTPTLEAACATDLNAIRAVLSASNLPVEDVERHINNFILARLNRTTIGMVAVEYARNAALVRSLCVVPEYRGQAIGTRLLSAIEEAACSRGVCDLYLLTTNSAGFFAQHGFLLIARADAPMGIQDTAQFRSLCPSSAVCMRKSLRRGSLDSAH